MSALVARSFPELAYLVMREVRSQRFFALSELVELAVSLGIENRIRCSYPAFSEAWIEQLNGGMKRDSGANNASNEARFCIFSPQHSSCTEPWGLAFEPFDGESYEDYRVRNRGTSVRNKKSAKAKAQEEAFYAQPATLVCVKGTPLYIVTPEEGDGRHFICLFASSVEYRSADGTTHRESESYELPAFFDWGGPSPVMKFCKSGKDHRLDGASTIYPEKSEDLFAVNNEDCGDASEPQTMKVFAARYRTFKGQALDPETAENLRVGRYRDFTFFEDELAEAKRLHSQFLQSLAEDEAEQARA